MFDQHRQGKLNLNFQSKIPPRISYFPVLWGGLWGLYQAQINPIAIINRMVYGICYNIPLVYGIWYMAYGIWYSMVWYGMVSYGIWYRMVWYGMV